MDKQSSQRNNEPLISFLLHDNTKEQLEENLKLIFGQNIIEHFEVVISDDATEDGAWELASKNALEFNGLISISRNNLPLGKDTNRAKGQLMCSGRYTIEPLAGRQINFKNIKKTIHEIKSGKRADGKTVYKTDLANKFKALDFIKNKTKKTKPDPAPLVSIYLYNFNYGRYLRQSFESALSQTYKNIEICFSDNASTDESWQIAMEFAKKNPGKISLTRNKKNLGPSENLWSCELNRRGKYLVKLCSDDALSSEFVSRCVDLLENNATAAFAMTHRQIMDESGAITQEPPFYDQTCLIPGASQAAVFMMAMMNPSVSQILYNAERMDSKSLAGQLNDRWHREHLIDFHLCTEYDVIYIKDPLISNRVHSLSDGSSISSNLLQCFTQYVLVHQFSDIASIHDGMESTTSRLPAAIEKIGTLCLRYAIRFLLESDEKCAKRYWHLSQAIYPGIKFENQFITLDNFWNKTEKEKEKILSEFSAQKHLIKRTVSYPPPFDAIPLS